jgi:site-specific recombinase XerC
VDLCDAVEVYVNGRRGRGEITARTAVDLRCRLRGLVAAAGPGAVMEGLDRATVAAWQATIGGHRPATRRAYLSTVRTFCRWAAAEELLPRDPTAAAARIREPRRATRAMPAASVARLRLVLPDLRAEVIVELMFRMGLRCVEVSRLRSTDYDPVAAVMTVVGKNSDERRLPVPGPVVVVLGKWSAAGGSGRDTTVGLSANRISRLVSAWMGAAGLKLGAYDGVSAHALRHTMASNMLERCGNVRTVQDALGHVSLATTERYLRHTDLDAMRAAMETG